MAHLNHGIHAAVKEAALQILLKNGAQGMLQQVKCRTPQTTGRFGKEKRGGENVHAYAHKCINLF